MWLKWNKIIISVPKWEKIIKSTDKKLKEADIALYRTYMPLETLRSKY